MRVVLRILRESLEQAWHELSSNRLRSGLSLVGITIGILCIIAVLSAVDSLKDNIKGSFEQLGNDILYVSKLPWMEDPGQNYWKYFQRPVPSYEDYQTLKTKLTTSSAVNLIVRIGGRTLKYRNNSVSGVFVMSGTYEFAEVFNLAIDRGRYYTPFEYENASDRIVIGHNVAQELFGTLDPIGKDIKLMGRTLRVIGVIKKSGKALVNPNDYDDAAFISYTLARKMTDVRRRNNPWGTQLNIKAADGVALPRLRDEVRGVLRAHRRLKPAATDDFSINEIGLVTQFLDAVFGVVTLAGIAIGFFAILVGMFSVANIMFVSVKERTALIGIKKALGAPRSYILLEFLIESVFLCVLGGIIGLLLVFGILQVLTIALDFPMYLSPKNIALGLSLSIGIGLLAGVIPANQAARLDPVEAMRSN